MRYRDFAVYNIVGGILWVSSMTLAGYYLGVAMGPDIEKQLHKIVAVVIFLSLLPAMIAWAKSKLQQRRSADAA